MIRSLPSEKTTRMPAHRCSNQWSSPSDTSVENLVSRYVHLVAHPGSLVTHSLKTSRNSLHTTHLHEPTSQSSHARAVESMADIPTHATLSIISQDLQVSDRAVAVQRSTLETVSKVTRRWEGEAVRPDSRTFSQRPTLRIPLYIFSSAR